LLACATGLHLRHGDDVRDRAAAGPREYVGTKKEDFGTHDPGPHPIYLSTTIATQGETQMPASERLVDFGVQKARRRGSKTVYAKLCIWKRTDQDAYNVSIPGSPKVITYVSNDRTSTRYAPHFYKFLKKLVQQAEKEAA
jgi:hypothetical protein